MQDSSYGVPVGTVIAWPVGTAPAGIHKEVWLECDGQTVDSNLYPRLAKLMSHVPDYSGMFLRGVGGNADGLGVKQGDAIRNITGYISGSHTIFDSYGGPFYDRGTRDGSPIIGTFHIETKDGTYYGLLDREYGLPDDFAFDVSRVVPTAEENRPVNKAVRYMIKAK